MNLCLLVLWQLLLCLPTNATWDSSQSHAPAPPEYNALVDSGTFGEYPVRTYATEQDLASPETNFLRWDPRCDDGSYYFLAPRGFSLPNPGPMILDSRGELVWTKHFDNKFGGQAYDFKVQTYMGEDYLTFWLGDDSVRGHGSGFYYLLNSSYDVVHRIGAANGLSADLHEFLITPDGTALMTMYEVVEHDLTNMTGYEPDPEFPDAPTYIWDCIFQEINISTGMLLFEWRMSDHLLPSETYREFGPGGTKDDPFDCFHINSIDKDGFGNYLISSRFTHAINYIDGTTGDIIWTLGGKRNDFLDLSDGNGLNFAWQHDARFHPIDAFPNVYTPTPPPAGLVTQLVTLFDNAAKDGDYDYGPDYARGILLELTYPIPDEYRGLPSHKRDAPPTKNRKRDESSKEETTAGNEEAPEEETDFDAQKLEAINGTNTDLVVRLIESYNNPEGVRSSSQGSVQVLRHSPEEDPKVLVGFGVNAMWTEYAADGTVLCSAHYAANTSWERGEIQSYRTYKFPWYGEPETEPKIEINDDDTEIYVSWNGATDVTDWILQCADSETDDEEDWADVIQVRKRGFETLIPMPGEVGESRYLRVIALDRNGRTFAHGTSKIIDRGAIASYLPMVSDRLPHEVGSLSTTSILIVLLLNVAIIFFLFDVYRRYLSWRSGRPSAGALRWRKGSAYRLVSEV